MWKFVFINRKLDFSHFYPHLSTYRYLYPISQVIVNAFNKKAILFVKWAVYPQLIHISIFHFIHKK